MTQADLIPLMCGVAYAAKAHGSGQEPASATGRRYLAVTLDGLRASPAGRHEPRQLTKATHRM